MNTIEAAHNRWHAILEEIGICKSHLVNKHGPCPMCGGTKPFRFDDKDGRGSWICTHCGAGNGIDLVMQFKQVDFREAAKLVDQIVGNAPERKAETKRKDPRPLLKRIHERLIRPTSDDPVGRYLAKRGLIIPELGVKYHPEMPYFDGEKYVSSHPAMVCEYRNQIGKTITYHVTYLTADGSKAAVADVKKTMPPTEPMAGGAIVTAKPEWATGVAEGLETALSAALLHDMPVWSCANAGMLEKWEPPAIVRDVCIFGDNDKNFAGHAAAYRLAHRLAVKGLHVTVAIPPHYGDWNDLLGSKAA